MTAKINRIAVGVLAIVVVFSASRVTQSPGIGARPLPNPKNSVGLIEHRGRYFFVEQLLDPGFRRVSRDPFVREFDIDTKVAEPWAGTNPEKQKAWRNAENLRLLDHGELMQGHLKKNRSNGRALAPLPWAGLNPEDLRQ